MYGPDHHRRGDLPDGGQLRRSTVLAAILAGVLLVTVVLPAEYAIDPTRIGRSIGLTEMGEIKVPRADDFKRIV